MKQPTKKQLKDRIEHLENLIEKAAEYVKFLENENEKLKKKLAESEADRKRLVDVFWVNEDLKKEIKELKKENQKCKLLTKVILEELDKTGRELERNKMLCDLYKDKYEVCKKSKEEEVITKEQTKETEEINELRSSLRELLTEATKKAVDDIKKQKKQSKQNKNFNTKA